MNSFKRPTMLMILDGFGQNPKPWGNAIMQARTPALNTLFQRYPGTTLKATGLDVGLPQGQMGNSEVGHLNMGAGRIVYQELTRITKEIQEGDFYKNPVLNQGIDHVLTNDSALHLFGLLSDGGVHSHISHLFALIDLAAKRGVKKLYIHCFLDGRDVPPRCALTYIKQLEAHMQKAGTGKIATISGRYYAMDRDQRWERVQKAYDAITLGEGFHAASGRNAIEQAYARDENDEFVQPSVICVESAAAGHFDDAVACHYDNLTVSDHDSIIMFNFRPDRAREITRAFVDQSFAGFTRKKKPQDLCYVCMTQYDAKMPNVNIAYVPQTLKNTLGEYLADLGLTQLRIAETEKYAHVTFFFNGGLEAPNKNEDRILIPSPEVATYDLQPEMSAYLVTERVLKEIAADKYDVLILNFANADMVGHTGKMAAASTAIEALDRCVPQIVETVLAKGGQILLTADHGNADCMFDEDEKVVTAHSLNPVPLLHIADQPVKLKDGGRLADLAPTLLDLMGLKIPGEMTGESLVSRDKTGESPGSTE